MTVQGTAESDRGTGGYVTFRLGGRVYATALSAVREIVRLEGLERLPAMRPPLAGVLDLRGCPLPVFDVRPTGAGEGRRGDVLVLEPEPGGDALGVAVDAVRAVVSAEALRASAALTGGAGAVAGGVLPPYVLDVLRDDEGPVFLVDLRRLCAAAA